MIVQLKNIDKHFQGVYAIKNLSFEIQKGSITSIVGPNGAGKTTLTNVLSGVVPLDNGSIIIANKEFKKISPFEIANYNITRTFQNVRLFEQMKVIDNLVVVMTKRSVWRSILEKPKDQEIYYDRARKILETVGLEKKENDLALNLSYGQRKLLEIGRALAMNSDIILLDEPFAGLFKEMIKVIIGILDDLKHQGKTIILIEHNMELIRQLSDHVIVMDSGELLAQGRADEVLSDPRVVEAYLGE